MPWRDRYPPGRRQPTPACRAVFATRGALAGFFFNIDGFSPCRPRFRAARARGAVFTVVEKQRFHRPSSKTLVAPRSGPQWRDKTTHTRLTIAQTPHAIVGLKSSARPAPLSWRPASCVSTAYFRPLFSHSVLWNRRDRGEAGEIMWFMYYIETVFYRFSRVAQLARASDC